MVRAIAAVSVVDALADDLRRRLFAGELPSGSPITEALLAADYNVSRSTAKAAIEKLTTEGLLQRGVHKSARVPQLRIDDVRDIYRTRLRLESSALRELALQRRAPAAAAEANARVRQAEGLLEAGGSIAAVEPDMQFHAALVEAIGSPRVERMYRSLVDEVRLCMAQVQGRSLLSVDQIATEHQEILDHLHRGDAEAAVACLDGHLSRASDRLTEALSSHN
jgi:DNA-binding GntR family transcriptional regulator